MAQRSLLVEGRVNEQRAEMSALLEPAIELAPRSEIEASQERKVLELVRYAWDRSAFYREFWGASGITPDDIKSLRDFVEKVPLMTKDDIRAFRTRTGDAFGGLLCVDPSELTSVITTSGTTGEPELIAEVWDSVPPCPTACLRDQWEWGLRPGDRIIVPAGTFKNYWDTVYNAMGLVPIFVDTWIGHGERVLNAIKRHEVAYMLLPMPLILEFEALEGRYDLREMLSSLKYVSFSGQPLGAVLRRKITEDWGVEIATFTSAGDCGLAWEGTDRDGFYLWEDTILPEVIDPVTQREVGDDEVGELVTTDFDNLVAPYIRFRSGDLVRRTRKVSSLGRTHSRMWVIGRMGDQTMVDGKAVIVSDIWAAIETLTETSDGMFQIVQNASKVGRLHLRIGYAPERTSDPGDLGERVVSLLEQKLGVGVDVDLMTVDEILKFSSSVAKFPRVVKQ
ncbi:phenylacetate--CoA ligase family protein [Prescottella equi]